VSICGHLFCWPCIHQWLETRANNPTCPVCKSSISREKLIPIYGRNAPQRDPRFEKGELIPIVFDYILLL